MAMEYGGQDEVYQTLNTHTVLVGRNYILLMGFLGIHWDTHVGADCCC